MGVPAFRRVCRVDDHGNVVLHVGIEYAGEEVAVVVRVPGATPTLEQRRENRPPTARENDGRQERRGSIG
jgi:hypothetical protein